MFWKYSSFMRLILCLVLLCFQIKTWMFGHLIGNQIVKIFKTLMCIEHLSYVDLDTDVIFVS